MEVTVTGDPRPERTHQRTSTGLDAPAHAGDDPFGRAIEAHRRDVVLLCYRFLGSIHEAEEAAQETALRAWRARDSFRGDASLRTWLHRIATRVCLDALDRRPRRVLPALGVPLVDRYTALIEAKGLDPVRVKERFGFPSDLSFAKIPAAKQEEIVAWMEAQI